MPISLQTTPVTPNAIFAPQIIISTALVGGKLQTSAQVFLAAAKVENAGQPNESWTTTGQNNLLYLADLDNLDTDLAGLQSQVNTVYAQIVTLLGNFNSIRRLL